MNQSMNQSITRVIEELLLLKMPQIGICPALEAKRGGGEKVGKMKKKFGSGGRIDISVEG